VPQQKSVSLTMTARSRSPHGQLEISETKKTSTLSVDSEYGKLRKVLIGRADGFRLPAPEHEPLLSERNIHGEYKLVGKPYPEKVINEANDSLEELVQKLKAHDPEIEIVRSSLESENNHNERVGNRGYSTRDVMIAVHDALYLCPTTHQSRATEAEDCFSSLIQNTKKSGNRVVDFRTSRWWDLVKSADNNFRAKDAQAEKAFLNKVIEQATAWDKDNKEAADGGKAGTTSPTYFRDQLPNENKLAITEEVPIFDAANILIADSKHLLYLTSISGNYHGLVHLKKVMKDNHGIEVIPVSGVYSGTHIDSTMCILNKNKILFCAERISLDQCYDLMSRCGYTDKSSNYIPVYKEDMTDVGLFSEDQNFASVYIGMNLLAIDENTLVVEAKQEKLIAKLKEHGFKIITVSYPHMRTMGGGVHCTTLPLLRSAME